ncbi:hypothetical protein [Salinicoccus kekensis]|uniref:Uncharacterized protein n=1 Tax=Salinicoccus kekensis TaxID=714307 RepID=A0A285UBN6_9STAP|nr:hypothetical protein [Salinicoccus kekensis]SOC39107.1 hypothetical protein SAMN05878391_0719 [Salinicoccus kekensis]
MSNTKILIITILGVLAGFLLFGVARYFGLPTFETFLTAAFGENNIWAVIFSLALILLIVFMIFRSRDKAEEN